MIWAYVFSCSFLGWPIYISTVYRWWAELLCRPVFSHFRTFRVTGHTHSHIIKLTVLLLSSRSHFIIRPRSFHYLAEVILLFSASNFSFAFLLLLCFLSHSCLHHGQCHGWSNSHLCGALWNLAFFIILCSFLFLFVFVFFFVLLFLAFCELHFHFLVKPSAWQPRPELGLAILGQHSLRATSGSAQKKLRSPHAMRNHVLRVELASSVKSWVCHGAPHFPWVLLFLSCEIYYSLLV